MTRVAYTAFGEVVLSDGQGGWTVGGEAPAGLLSLRFIRSLLIEKDLRDLLAAAESVTMSSHRIRTEALQWAS